MSLLLIATLFSTAFARRHETKKIEDLFNDICVHTTKHAVLCDSWKKNPGAFRDRIRAAKGTRVSYGLRSCSRDEEINFCSFLRMDPVALAAFDNYTLTVRDKRDK